MKQKDLVYSVLAAIIFAITGVVAYGQFGGKKTDNKTVLVEVVAPIPADFNQDALKILDDQSQARNFTPVFDLNNGLNNFKPFNPI